MWLSFLTSSYERAVWWNEVANSVLIGSLVVGVIATFVIVRTSSTKEDYLARNLADTNERAAKAELRAAEANLELEKLKAPRTLTVEQQSRIVDKVKTFSGITFEVVTYPGEPEPVAFSSVIAATLIRAGWAFNPNNVRDALIGFASGIVIVVGKQAGPRAEQAGATLLDSLISEGVDARLAHNSLVVAPIPIAIKIQVAKKP